MKIKEDKTVKFNRTFSNREDFSLELKSSRKRFLATTKKKNGKLISWNDKALKEESNRLMVLFGIPESLRDDVMQIIKTGKIKFSKSPTEPQILLERASPNNEEILTMKVFKYTTEKEYKHAWKKVKDMQGEMRERYFKPISKKELRVIKLSKQGKTDSEIAKNVAVDLSNIRKIINRKGTQLNRPKK